MIENMPLENLKNPEPEIPKTTERGENEEKNENAPELPAAFAEETIKLTDAETELFIKEGTEKIEKLDKQAGLPSEEITGASQFTAKLDAIHEKARWIFTEMKESFFSLLGIKESFAPAEELAKIKKAPKEKRPRLLSEFKEKWRQQKEGLAKVQELMIGRIRENPDMPLKELYEEAMKTAAPYNLSFEQKTRIGFILFNYAEKHREVEKIRKKYPDDTDLYAAVFGKKPDGKIEVIKGPMTLFFRAYNINDYAYIYTQAFMENRKLTLKDVFAARRTGGVSLGNSLIKGLEGTIIAQNIEEEIHPNSAQNQAGTNAILVHEEQHAIKRLFPEYVNNQKLWKLDEEMMDLALGGAGRTEMENFIKYSFRKDREDMEIEAKNEILAFLKEEFYWPKEVFHILTKKQKEGGSYDYFAASQRPERIDFIAKLSNAPVHEIAEDVYKTEYHRLIKEGIDAFTELRKSGYSTEETIALLINEPLAKWEKVVKRLLEK